jgi:hypothetical protein
VKVRHRWRYFSNTRDPQRSFQEVDSHTETYVFRHNCTCEDGMSRSVAMQRVGIATLQQPKRSKNWKPTRNIAMTLGQPPNAFQQRFSLLTACTGRYQKSGHKGSSSSSSMHCMRAIWRPQKNAE